MTKHDTWVKLKPGNPYESIIDLFPNGMIPMPDPFPLERTTGSNGKGVMLKGSKGQRNSLIFLKLHHNHRALELGANSTTASTIDGLMGMKCRRRLIPLMMLTHALELQNWNGRSK
ncbi:hypothetical protein [Nostoc sp.]|uniref:hypothetical protein n=1 Tax=Nostoc sp. TaxID=1180 RepID=UPI002FFCDFF9